MAKAKPSHASRLRTWKQLKVFDGTSRLKDTKIV
jgi:hypothetical protein